MEISGLKSCLLIFIEEQWGNVKKKVFQHKLPETGHFKI